MEKLLPVSILNLFYSLRDLRLQDFFSKITLVQLFCWIDLEKCMFYINSYLCHLFNSNEIVYMNIK